MDQTTIDNLSAHRFIHYLITPIDQWEACRMGIIDRNGKVLREPKNSNETQFFNMFHILSLKIRDLLKSSGKGTNWVLPSSAGSFYLGNKTIPAANFTNWNIANRASLPIFGAAYSSMRECMIANDSSLLETYMHVYLDKQDEDVLNEMATIFEDGPGTTSANVVGIAQPVGAPIMNKYKKENIKKTILSTAVSKMKDKLCSQ